MVPQKVKYINRTLQARANHSKYARVSSRLILKEMAIFFF